MQTRLLGLLFDRHAIASLVIACAAGGCYQSHGRGDTESLERRGARDAGVSHRAARGDGGTTVPPLECGTVEAVDADVDVVLRGERTGGMVRETRWLSSFLLIDVVLDSGESLALQLIAPLGALGPGAQLVVRTAGVLVSSASDAAEHACLFGDLPRISVCPGPRPGTWRVAFHAVLESSRFGHDIHGDIVVDAP